MDICVLEKTYATLILGCILPTDHNVNNEGDEGCKQDGYDKERQEHIPEQTTFRIARELLQGNEHHEHW